MSKPKSAEKIAFETLTATIKTKLMENPAWVERAILVLYAHQTSDEQETQETGHENSRGFNKPDAKRLSFVAEFLKKGGHLTKEKALGIYGKKLCKYAKQLAKIAQEKKATEAQQQQAA